MVKQSHYKPEQAYSAPGAWGSEIKDNRHMKVERLSALRICQSLPHRKFLVLISVGGSVDLSVIVLLEELCKWKIPMTLSGIEPATLRVVAKCLNQLRHRVPLLFSDTIPKFNLTCGRKPRIFSVRTACNWLEFRPRTFRTEALVRANVILWTITAVLPT
jgi:hypothetical protein